MIILLVAIRCRFIDLKYTLATSFQDAAQNHEVYRDHAHLKFLQLGFCESTQTITQ